MKIYKSQMIIPASRLLEDNPLAKFRDINHHKDLIDGGLLEEELKGYGYETGFRVLPYTMQENYFRKLAPSKIQTVVMENSAIRAEFLSGFGGRLWSLYDKKKNKELLFKNPVLRIANLAIRNAWFAGGVEWNLGQFGHSCQTCEPVFFARCTDKRGREFLRMYEYERQKGLFYQIDFHIEEDSPLLYAHVTIINSHDNPVPLYWWTNIAVREEKNIRVLSGSDEVIYIQPQSLASEQSVHSFAHGKMPYLPTLDGLDASYPANLAYSNEYFFQNSDAPAQMWEAAAYDDGFAFWERSTSPLRYRKMFCWGTHTGGSHWKDFLSLEGQGDYLEVQAGLAPTQVHGMDIAARERISFTQVFGSALVDKDKVYDIWNNATEYMQGVINGILDGNILEEKNRELESCSHLPVQGILAKGSGWGALEAVREPGILPKSMIFDTDTMGTQQQPWLDLLTKGYLPEQGTSELPASWMVDPRWMSILEKSLENKENQNRTAWLHMGVMLCENERFEEAVEALLKSYSCSPSAIGARTLAQVYARRGEVETACKYIQQATGMGGGEQSCAMAQEYIALHNAAGKYGQAWVFYEQLPEHLKTDERVRLSACTAASHCDEWDFVESQFGQVFATIREGESMLLEIWQNRHAALRIKELGLDLTAANMARIIEELQPPYHLDFRAAPPKQ